jgi:hypothetical protein
MATLSADSSGSVTLTLPPKLQVLTFILAGLNPAERFYLRWAYGLLTTFLGIKQPGEKLSAGFKSFLGLSRTSRTRLFFQAGDS